MTTEIRALPSETKLRGRTAFGYAAVFNSESRDLGGWKEIVTPQAFNKSAGDGYPGVKAKWEHRDLLGTTAAGTARPKIDSHGLYYEIDLPNSRPDVAEYIERGDAQGASFEFSRIGNNADHWEQRSNGMPIRFLDSVRLHDISIVTDPAYPAANASVRSMEGALESFAAWVEAPLEEVVADFERRNLQRYYRRSDIMSVPTPLEVVQRKTAEPRGITGEETQRWLEAHKPNDGMDWHQAWLQLKKREIDYDATVIAKLPARHYAPASTQDGAAAANQAILQEAIRRRVNALRQNGIDVPDTSRGTQWTHPAIGQRDVALPPDVAFDNSRPAVWTGT